MAHFQKSLLILAQLEDDDKSLEKVRLNNQSVDAVAYVVVVIAAVAPADAGAAKRRRVRQN